MGFQNNYNYYMTELSAPLTRDWPLICSPYIILITLAYLYFVLNIGPRYMQKRPPYNLKTFILLYNFTQILANFWLIKEHISVGWLSKYTFKCFPPNPTSPDAIKMFNIIWWTLLLKLYDYVETCIFVLRKKQNQISALHIYHHVSNLSFGWYYLKYILDERILFVTLINCNVHVLMYIYYFTAAWSPKLQKIIFPIKPYVTRIQMIQFVVIVTVLLQAVLPSCEVPANQNLLILFIINILIFTYLFYNFYQKSYKKRPTD